MGQGSQTVNIWKPEEGPSQPRRSNWSPDNDELLVKLLMEECTENKTCSGSFNPSAWARVFNAYGNKTKEDITVQQLKSRWKTLKKLYRLYSSLVNKGGWSWDHDNHLPTPGCSIVWEEIIQFNKEYKVSRDKPFPLFWMIHELAGSSTATGQYASHTGCGEYRATPIVEVQESTDSTGDAAEKQVEKNTETWQQAGIKVRSMDYASGSSKRKPLKTLPDITDEELFIGGKALRSRKDRIFFMKMRPSAQSYWLRAHVKEWHDQFANAVLRPFSLVFQFSAAAVAVQEPLYHVIH
ncbi:hypothetical protein J5N97_024627 [Dioscorea zingiberensis]|uniref:Myb/SANT-like domain-containing protein n=1 Tax=Dioscorea zingiberensis TaxID=325984 RepID=A0A9D5H944_9LILI|nr:hypothetical protein J5N97_024627 [Dioscorea zingiberensis]